VKFLKAPFSVDPQDSRQVEKTSTFLEDMQDNLDPVGVDAMVRVVLVDLIQRC